MNVISSCSCMRFLSFLVPYFERYQGLPRSRHLQFKFAGIPRLPRFFRSVISSMNIFMSFFCNLLLINRGRNGNTMSRKSCLPWSIYLARFFVLQLVWCWRIIYMGLRTVRHRWRLKIMRSIAERLNNATRFIRSTSEPQFILWFFFLRNSTLMTAGL